MADDATTPSGTTSATTAVTSKGDAPSPSDWRAALPEELRAEKSLESFKDVGALAKSYVETKRLVGARPVVPGPDAKPEEIAAYRKAIGVPDTPEGYQVKAHPMMLHSEWNREAQAAFMTLAHAQGMPPAAVERVLHWYGDFMGAQVKSNDALNTEAKATLRQEWGPNYEAYLGAANRGLSRVEAEAGLEAGALVEAVKGSDPRAVAKAFHWIESQFTEHGWVQGVPVHGVSREEALSKVAEIDRQLATLDPNSARVSDLVDEKIRYLNAARRAA